MKLTEETIAPSPISKALEPTPKPWKRFQKWAFTHLKSSTGLTLEIGVLTLLALTGLLGIDAFNMVKIAENELSKQDYYAPYDMAVLDEAVTRHRQYQARQGVPPIYLNEHPLNQEIEANLDDLFKRLEAVKVDSSVGREAKKEQIQTLTQNHPEAGFLAEQLLSPSMGAPRWERNKLLTRMTLHRLLAQGISPSEYFEKREEIIQQIIPTRGIHETDRHLVGILVGAVVKPNRLIDEVSWDQAKELAASQVPPETKYYRKGQKILTKGEKVTATHMKAFEAMGKSVTGINWPTLGGIFLLTGFALSAVWGYLYFYENRQFFKPVYAILVSSLMLGILALFKGVTQYPWPLEAMPLGAFALTLSIFTHPRVGILVTTLVILLAGVILKADFSILAMLLFGSMVGVFVLSRRMNFSDRGQLMLAGLCMGLTHSVILVALFLLNTLPPFSPHLESFLSSLGWSLFASGIGSGIVTSGLLPYLESLFSLVTPFTLIELGNHDKPLLKRMQFEAPGTFHHSLMVSTLSEAAAEAIGANPLLARVGSLYHDIGKMKRPLFFIENQAYFGVENPHDRLTPRLSKMVVTAHPRDSVEMARQYHLPEVLIKFMKEHHGTLVAGYFYNQACIDEGAENVNKSQFRYPGPKPTLKETAIVMLADAAESSVRALKNPTPGQIEERIEKIIRQRVEDGQFDNCPITFKDMTVIKDTFVRVLRGIQHNRIEYQQTVMRELGRKLPLNEVSKSPPAPGSSSSSKEKYM